MKDDCIKIPIRAEYILIGIMCLIFIITLPIAIHYQAKDECKLDKLCMECGYNEHTDISYYDNPQQKYIIECDGKHYITKETLYYNKQYDKWNNLISQDKKERAVCK